MRRVAHAVRQRLAIALDALHDAVVVGDEVVDALALDRRAVDVEHAVDHLNAVAGQTDDALDVVDRVVLRQAEHHDVAALRLRGEKAAGKDRRRERQRVVGIAVGIFGDEQIIADQQGRNHRAGRNIEGLKQKGADDERDDQGMEHHAYCLGESALFPFGSCLHAHRPVVSRFHAPARDLVAAGAVTSNCAREFAAASDGSRFS